MPGSGAVRLVDVAKRAGVAASTASRALARPELVSPETRARVEAAAEALGYVPNRIARSLITGRTGMVAVVVPDLTYSNHAFFARAVQDAARERGYQVFVAEASGEEIPIEELIRMAGPWCDGVITWGGGGAGDLDFTDIGTPLVFVNARSRRHPSVLIDPASTVDAQVDHLRALGHERIVVQSGAAGWWWSDRRANRARQLAEQLPGLEVARPAFGDYDTGRRIFADLTPDVTAVACFNDRQAIGFIHEARDRGIRVPEHLSVVGLGDVGGASYIDPPLTSVVVPFPVLGRAALRLLLEPRESGTVMVERIPVDLVVRSSTAAPRARGLLHLAAGT